MKKLLSVVSIFLLMLSTIAPSITFAAADSKPVYKDGTYDIPVSVLHGEKDEPSMMEGSVSGAKVIIKEDVYTIHLGLTNATMIKSLKVEQNGKMVEADVIEDTGKDRTVSFEMSDLAAIISGQVHVSVPGVYETTHDVRFQFDASELPVVETPAEPEPEPEEPENPGVEEPEEPTLEIPAGEPEHIYADGTYELPMDIWKDSEDVDSSMKNFVGNPASLTMKDGKATVQLTLSSSSLITSFQIMKSDGKFYETEVVKEDKEANTRVVSFEVKNLDGIVPGKVAVLSGPLGLKEHIVRFQFNTEQLPLAEEPETPEKPEQPDGELADGNYTIAFEALHASEDKPSAAGDYMKSPAKLAVNAGAKKVFVTLTDNKSIQSFEVKQGDAYQSAEVIKVDKKANTRVVAFPVSDLGKTLSTKMKVHVEEMNYTGEYEVRVVFDQDSIQETDEDIDVEEEPEEKPEPEKPTNPGTEPENPKEDEGNIDEGKACKDIDPKNLEDGTYFLEYVVLKDKTEESSLMNQYVVSPGKLTVKDGKQHLAITMKSSSTITDFKVEQQGKLVEPKMVEHNKKADTRVVEFEVEDLYQKLNGAVTIDVKMSGFDYHGSYDVQFKFNPETITCLDDGKQTPKDPVTPPAGDDNSGPNFDRNDDVNNNSGNDNQVKPTGTNPKTGDTTNLLLYTLLLIGSLIPLTIQLRKRKFN